MSKGVIWPQKRENNREIELLLDPVYMEWGTPVQWGRFLLFCVPQNVKTEETNPTTPGFPTPCKQALSFTRLLHGEEYCRAFMVTNEKDSCSAF